VDSIDRYWRKNMLIMFLLLVIWAVVGLGCGVLLADRLNQFALGGFPLGFWFAQQGSIIVFIFPDPGLLCSPESTRCSARSGIAAVPEGECRQKALV